MYRPDETMRPITLWLLMLLSMAAALGGCASISWYEWSDLGGGLNNLQLLLKNLPRLRSGPSPPPSAPLQPATTLTPFAIAPGPDGNLWFTELREARIGRITPLGEIATFELGSGGLPERLTA